ncbi:MAG: MFS transporter [Porticoccaceae bacterium]
MHFHYRWHVLAFALVMQALTIGIGVYCFTFFVVHWVAEFNTPRSELMLAYMGMTLVTGLLAPFYGILIDRAPSRWVITGGVVAFSLGLLAVAAAPNAIAIILCFWLVLPLGIGLAGPLMAQTLVAQAFATRRGMALGICALGTSIGGLVMPVVTTTLLTHLAWRPVIATLAIVIAVLVLPLTFLIVKNRAPNAKPGDDKPAITTRELLRNKELVLLGIAYFAPSSLFIAVLQNMGLYAKDLDISQQQAGVIVAAAALLMAGGKFITGVLADRFDYHRIYYCLLGLAGTGLVVAATSNSFAPVAAGVLLLGATAGGVLPLVSVMVAQRFGVANFGRAMGVIMVFGAFSGVAPLAAGWIRDFSGSYEISFLVLTPLMLPALFCFSRLKKQ